MHGQPHIRPNKCSPRRKIKPCTSKHLWKGGEFSSLGLPKYCSELHSTNRHAQKKGLSFRMQLRFPNCWSVNITVVWTDKWKYLHELVTWLSGTQL